MNAPVAAIDERGTASLQVKFFFQMVALLLPIFTTEAASNSNSFYSISTNETYFVFGSRQEPSGEADGSRVVSCPPGYASKEIDANAVEVMFNVQSLFKEMFLVQKLYCADADSLEIVAGKDVVFLRDPSFPRNAFSPSGNFLFSARPIQLHQSILDEYKLQEGLPVSEWVNLDENSQKINALG